MSEEQVVRNCAPTLAGLKTGNLFACPYENREDLLDFLRSLNRRLGKKGVRAMPPTCVPAPRAVVSTPWSPATISSCPRACRRS